jgi:hypothetical protein
MKSIKFIFAFLLFTVLFVSCTADDITEDEALYGTEEIQAIGEDGTTEIDTDRDL